jgi:hypothetical protein
MVYILQADNRPINGYIAASVSANKRIAIALGWNYIFKTFNARDYNNIHPAAIKIWIMQETLKELPLNEIIVFLDSDAWIQSSADLQNIIAKIVTDEKQGAFSRDPYVPRDTYINSGSFIIRNTEFIQKLYEDIIDETRSSEYLYKWPYDQKYISDAIFKNKEQFIIFEPLVLNTPAGIVLRHNWFKNGNMMRDLERADVTTTAILSLDDMSIYDTMPWPNVGVNSYDPSCWRAKMTPI